MGGIDILNILLGFFRHFKILTHPPDPLAGPRPGEGRGKRHGPCPYGALEPLGHLPSGGNGGRHDTYSAWICVIEWGGHDTFPAWICVSHALAIKSH